MNIHAIVNSSYVNGPGNRTVIWTQGCTKGCKNCFNPETWSQNVNLNLTPIELYDIIKHNNSDGLTLTGGDPLEQPEELLELLLLLKNLELPKGIILFTGYTIRQIQKLNNEATQCLKYIDVLIDGKYVDNLKIENSLKGSSNQNFHFFSNKIERNELVIDQQIEIGFSNKFYITGFPNINKNFIKKFGVYVD